MVSLSPAGYVETTILLPDSVAGINNPGTLLFHAPNNSVYVGGDDSCIIAVNAWTNTKHKRIAVGAGPHVLCSDPAGNKIYCANDDSTITVIDGANDQPVKTIPAEKTVTDFLYNKRENRLYCGNQADSFVRVIDCAGDSVVARVPVSFGPGELCYNAQLNRVYCAHKDRDEVSIIDCAAETVVGAIWIRGVEPVDICYDSLSNCVYTANNFSSSVSVIDCAGDTFLRLEAVGRGPDAITTGPPGKVYCANSGDGSVSVISNGGVKKISTASYPAALNYDPVNNKVYCGSSVNDSVAVIDADEDAVVARVAAGSYPSGLCYSPAGSNTFVACDYEHIITVIGGASDSIESVLNVGPSHPGPLCYSTQTNHLYCLDGYLSMLFVIDGNSNRVLRAIPIPASNSDPLLWSPASNKVYVVNSSSGAVSILDCARDSIIATVDTSGWPSAMCYSDGGRVYVADYDAGSIAVIDGSGDSVLTVLPINGGVFSLCYDRTDNKIYVGKGYGRGNSVRVIDADGDTVVASIPTPHSDYARVCWNQNYNKVYVSATNCDSLAVIDCEADTVLRNVQLQSGLSGLYSDSVCKKVYGIDNSNGYLRIFEAASDSLRRSLRVGYVTALLDNGKQGPANRLYCTERDSGTVAVVAGYKTDSVLRHIGVGVGPVALAWNPLHSWVYVSNSGSSSITVIRDTFGVGLEESQPQAPSHKLQASVVRRVLFLPGAGKPQAASLLDISGRKVMDLKRGANDVRALAPGVYFVRAARAQAQVQAIRKVIITR